MNRYIKDPSLISSNPDFQRILEYSKGETQRSNQDSTAYIH